MSGLPIVRCIKSGDPVVLARYAFKKDLLAGFCWQGGIAHRLLRTIATALPSTSEVMVVQTGALLEV